MWKQCWWLVFNIYSYILLFGLKHILFFIQSPESLNMLTTIFFNSFQSTKILFEHLFFRLTENLCETQANQGTATNSVQLSGTRRRCFFWHQNGPRSLQPLRCGQRQRPGVWKNHGAFTKRQTLAFLVWKLVNFICFILFHISTSRYFWQNWAQLKI